MTSEPKRNGYWPLGEFERVSDTLVRYTNCLFRVINNRKTKERSGLVCPLCRALLEPLKLSKDENGWQTCWWVCRNTIDQKCTFPGEVPPEVFWVKRSPEDIAEGYVPPPNFKALPSQLRHFYPKIFPQYSAAPTTASGSTATPTQISADEPFLRTQDNSLNSESAYFGGGSTIVGEENSIILDNASQVQIVEGSNSLVTDTTGSSSSTARLGAGAGVVPSVSILHKRPSESIDVSRAKQTTFTEELQRLLESKTFTSDQLMEIAQKLKQIEDSPPVKKKKEELLSRDEYNDGILTHIPDITHEDVAKVVKQKSITEKIMLSRHARLAESGTEILKNFGFHGNPVPETNKWREDTMKQVNTVLNKARRETKKAMEKFNTPSGSRSTTYKSRSSSALGYASSSRSAGDIRKKQAEQIEMAEANKKVAALIQNTYKTVLENKRDAIMQQLEVKRQQQQEQSQKVAVIQPKKEDSETSSRMRTDSFNMNEFTAFHQDFMYDPNDGYSDLFDNLGYL